MYSLPSYSTSTGIIIPLREDWKGGVNITGAKVTNLRYVDIIMLLEAEVEMASLLGTMEEISRDMALLQIENESL